MKQRCLALLLALLLVLTLCACAGFPGGAESREEEGDPSSSTVGSTGPVAWDPVRPEEEERSAANSADYSTGNRRSGSSQTDSSSPVGVAARFMDAMMVWNLSEASRYVLEDDVAEIFEMEEYLELYAEEGIDIMMDLVTTCFARSSYRITGDTASGDAAEVTLRLTVIDGAAIADDFAEAVTERFEREGYDAYGYDYDAMWGMFELYFQMMIEAISAPNVPTKEVVETIVLERENGRWAVDFDDSGDVFGAMIECVEYLSDAMYYLL